MYFRYMLNKISLSTIISLIFLLLGLAIADVLEESIGFSQLEEQRWKIIAPIALPLAGVIIGIVGAFQAKRYYKLLPLLLIVINLGFAALIFLDYAFSYWEF